jgi:hypothetical protein
MSISAGEDERRPTKTLQFSEVPHVQGNAAPVAILVRFPTPIVLPAIRNSQNRNDAAETSAVSVDFARTRSTIDGVPLLNRKGVMR